MFDSPVEGRVKRAVGGTCTVLMFVLLSTQASGYILDYLSVSATFRKNTWAAVGF